MQTQKMKPEVKKLFVAALRSGEYKQAEGYLRTHDNCFCVMGVLCNLHAQAHPEIAAEQVNPLHYMGSRFGAPPSVLAWAGLKRTPSLNHNGIQRNIVHLNDVVSLPFEKLADMVEKQL